MYGSIRSNERERWTEDTDQCSESHVAPAPSVVELEEDCSRRRGRSEGPERNEYSDKPKDVENQYGSLDRG